MAIILDGDIGVTAADVAATTLSINAGYGSNAAAYGCRAWVNFNGTGVVAIRDSGNVSSITDNGTGDYTINFAIAMPDVNYSVTGGCLSAGGANQVSLSTKAASGGSVPTLKTVSAIRLITHTSILYDPEQVNVAIFR